ncbi:MAG: methyltransferase domain-containing protein [Nitrolancea sp.]
MSRREETLNQLQSYIARAPEFSGWSFGDVDATPLEPGPPWDYEAIAQDHARTARRILDLGTGGGEVLERIIGGLDRPFVATEEWYTNAPVARARLAPLGGEVVRCSSLALPFCDASFDLVLDRHEELDPAEVVRVLVPGGRVVTQQVVPEHWPELTEFFPHRQRFPDHFALYAAAFESAGMRVDRAHHEHRVAYGSLGDVVFMLLTAPWTIPGFDPIKEIDALLAFEDAHGSDDGIVLTEGYYLIEGQKPG